MIPGVVKVLLPYSLFAGLGLAIWCSFHRPAAAPPASPASADVTTMDGRRPCAGCGAPVPASRAVMERVGEQALSFCCVHCRDRHFGRSDATAVSPATAPLPRKSPVDPVCHMEVTPAWGYAAQHAGTTYYFCTAKCREQFLNAPEQFLGDRCVVCQRLNDPDTAVTATYLDRTWRLCSEEHRQLFKADPASYFLHTMWGLPNWMYYLSIATVLVVSFGILERGGNHRSDDPALVAIMSPASWSRERVDLLRSRVLRYLLTARPLRFASQAVVVASFLLIIAAGLFGNQNPALNIAPLLTWTIWWGGLVVLILFAGKAWCWVCPWDAIAGWMEKLRFWRKNDEGLGLELKWPRSLRNILIATLLFVGLTWVELGFGVTMRPRVTAYLALAMLGLAIAGAFLFERKSFCRYACLVGRVSGLYALFAGSEVRTREPAACRSCAGKECVRGSATAYGCPTFLFPGNLSVNTYCIQCLECVQACPTDNLTINLRPWGADLVAPSRPRTDEAYLALLMLSITGFHGLTMTARWGELTGWLQQSLSWGHLLAFSLGMSLLLAGPILLYALLVALSYRLAGTNVGGHAVSYHDYFVRYAYALLPIALFYHLAHNLEHLLMEGPKVVALASDPFGWNWNLLGTAGWSVPPLVSLDVLWVVQVVLVLIGHVYSLWVAHHTARQLFPSRTHAFRSQLPMLVAMIAFSIFSLWLLKQPMEMRTSAM